MASWIDMGADFVEGGVDTVTDVTTDPIGDQFDNEPGGGWVDMLGGNVAAGAETAEGLAFGVFDTGADWLGAGGDFVGDAVIGGAETGSEVAGEAGEGVGDFFGGALNTQTLALLGIALVVAYIVLNSDAGEAAGSISGA